MTPYINRVVSNIKGGVDVTLSRHTVVCGPNGSGKSSIVQAMELATSGWVTDSEGRSKVKLHTSLARLFSGNDLMFADAWLSDDTKFSWSMQPGKKPDHLAPSRVRWVMAELNEMLGGEVNTVRAWLESQVSGGFTREDILSVVPPEAAEEASWLMRQEKTTDFLALSAAAKGRARELRSNATRKEGTIDQLLRGVPAPLLPSERERLAVRLKELEASSSGGMTAGQLDSLKSQLDTVIDAYVAELAKSNKEDPNEEKRVNRLVRAVQLVAEHVEAFGVDEFCQVCGSQEYVSPRRAEELMKLVAPLRDAIATRKNVESMKKEMSDLAERIKSAVVVDHQEMNSVRERLVSDKSAKQSWSNAAQVRTEVDGMRRQADLLSKVADALDEAGRAQLNAKKVKFESEVSGYLPNGEKFEVDLESARIGLVRNGVLHSALSGAEWNRVLLALSSLVTDDSTPSLLVPTDRAWDRDTLAAVMAALSGSPAQILIMSTVTPAPVEGWSLLEL